MANYQKVKGTIDFYGPMADKLEYVYSYASDLFERYGYTHIVTPIFEYSEVFEKNVGEDSDIVGKEMYTFKDKGDRLITLRPEGTAAVARCYIENKMYANPGLTKLYYYGPMFRYERPQVGRYREFKQFGVEVYGKASYLLDAEVILSAYELFKGLGIKNIVLKVNSIGDFESRKNYSNALKAHFAPFIDTMCDDCKRRINTNPLRILDCKVDKEHEAIKKAPKINEFLNEESKEYFNKLTHVLDELKIEYEVDYSLVRGLDYYTDTVFEFIIKSDDELNGLAICGGGRYADMIKNMSGQDVPGIGYGFGIERIIAIMDKLDSWNLKDKSCDVVVFGLDEESKIEAFKMARALRDLGYQAQIEYDSYSLKAQFKLADRVKAKYIVIIGEEERKNNIYTFKNTITKEQKSLSFDEILNEIKK